MKSEDRCGDYLIAVVVIGSEFNVRALGIVIIFCVHQWKQYAQAPTSVTEGYWHEEAPEHSRIRGLPVEKDAGGEPAL